MNMKNSYLLKELFWIILVFSIALVAALHHMHQLQEKGVDPFFYQRYFEPAVMVACGKGMAIDNGGKGQALGEFLALKSKSFSCQDLPEKQELIYQFPAKSWYYMMLTVGYAWKLVGITWDAVDKLVAVLFAFSASFAYGLFRLGTYRWLSAAIAVAFSLSPVQIEYLGFFRDYAKAPFFLGGLLILAILVTQSLTQWRKLFLVVVLGVLVGVGYGFRPDLLILLPLAVITFLLFQPEGIKKQSVFHVGMALLLILTFFWVAYPIIENNKAMGSCTWHFPLLGLGTSFTDALKLNASLYSWIYQFNDMLAFAMVDSFGERVHDLSPVGYCTSMYDQTARGLYLAIATTFPADFITRFLSSIDLVLKGHMPTGVGYFFVILAFIEIWLRSKRIGLFFLAAIIYFGGYPFLQFHERHYFYTEVFLLGSMALGIMLVIRQAKYLYHNGAILDPITINKLKAMLLTVLILAGICVSVKYLAKVVQERNLAVFTSALGKLKRDKVEVAPRQENNGLIVDLTNFLHQSRPGGIVSELAVVKIDSKRCNDLNPAFRVQYATNNPSLDFSEDVYFQVLDGERYRNVYLPLYYVELSAVNKSQPNSLVFSEANKDCFIALERIADRKGVPLWIQISVPDNAHSDDFRQVRK